MTHRFSNTAAQRSRVFGIDYVAGNPDYRGVCITEGIHQFGAFHPLLRAHDHLWRDTGWPFDIRYEVAHMLFMLSSEVPLMPVPR